MADYPSMPLFTDAYLRDCWHLTDAEHGRYLLLLMLMWQTPGCRIPNDVEWIARRLRRGTAAAHAEIMPLISEFCQTDGNWITQKRLQREFQIKSETSKKQSDKAKLRWNKENEESHGYAKSGIPSGKAGSMPPSPSPFNKNARAKGSKGNGANGQTFVDFSTDLGRKVQDWHRSHGKVCPGNGLAGWRFDDKFLSEVSRESTAQFAPEAKQA